MNNMAHDNKHECSVQEAVSHMLPELHLQKYFLVFPLLIPVYQRSKQEYYYQRKNLNMPPENSNFQSLGFAKLKISPVVRLKIIITITLMFSRPAY